MNKSLFAAAVVSTALVAGAAQAQVIGHVGANYALTNVAVDDLPPAFDNDTNVDSFQAEGAAAFDLGGFGALVDGALTYVDADGVDDTAYSLTGHLNGTFGGALVGGFFGVNGNDDETLWGVGLEAQTQLGASTTLYGQAGYGWADDLLGTSSDADLWAARVELRHFYSETLKVQGSVGYTNIDVAGGDADVWSLGLEGEYQFAGTPWSVLAGYEYSHVSDLDVSSNTLRIGGRYTFGGTLKARNDAGADRGSVRQLFSLGGL